MDTRVNYSGLVIAGIGFFLTRFTVTLAIYEDPVRFYLAGVVPLVLGLGLSAFGVALTVADVERSLVRTTALWCVVGAGTMLVLVVLTLLGSTTGDMPAFETMRSRTYLSNFLIGGSVGGTLTGLYAARNRRQRGVLRQQANRLEVLNRLLRHEVLNALTAIKGYAALQEEDADRARDVIDARTAAIEETIEEVKHLTRSAGTNEAAVGSIALEPCIRESVRRVEDRHPDASISVADVPEGLTVVANSRLERVFTHLLENAVVHAGGGGADAAADRAADTVTDGGGDSPVAVSVAATATTVRVSVHDEGPGLPEREQALLETGTIDRFDDPGTGFGLNVVRFLVENYRGTIETDVTAGGTTVTVELPRGDTTATGLRTTTSGLTGVRPAIPHLVVTLVAAVVAGVCYGIVAEAIGGSIGIIGVLYGVRSPVVGWITHEFHSVVFGFVFFGFVTRLPARYRDHLAAYVAVGTGWALVLWLFAAGVVSPVWLRLLGLEASIPTLSRVTFVSHLVWGVSLGALAALGFEHATPWLTRLGDRTG